MAKPTKPSRRPAPAPEAESHYESRQRMSWIDEGGIDLRAARANLLEFIAGLYEEALKLIEPQPPAPVVNPARQGARKPKAKPKVGGLRKKVPARAKKKVPIRRKKVPARGKKKVAIRRKKAHKRRK